jgi:hypothetical protein
MPGDSVWAPARGTFVRGLSAASVLYGDVSLAGMQIDVLAGTRVDMRDRRGLAYHSNATLADTSFLATVEDASALVDGAEARVRLQPIDMERASLTGHRPGEVKPSQAQALAARFTSGAHPLEARYLLTWYDLLRGATGQPMNRLVEHLVAVTVEPKLTLELSRDSAGVSLSVRAFGTMRTCQLADDGREAVLAAAAAMLSMSPAEFERTFSVEGTGEMLGGRDVRIVDLERRGLCSLCGAAPPAARAAVGATWLAACDGCCLTTRRVVVFGVAHDLAAGSIVPAG